MSQHLAPRQSPEERELEKKRSELAALEAELAQRELDLTTLQAELRTVEARYFRAVGLLFAELDELQARLAEAQARRDPRDSKLQQEAAEARAQATASAEAVGTVTQRQQDADFAPSEDLKRLYREIAKLIHPDLTTDEGERARRNRLMAEANRAYAEGNEAKLRNVFDLVARLREASVFFALNHLLHFYEPRVPFDAYLRLLEVVPALEVRNGTMTAAHNRLSEQIAAAWTPGGGGPRLASVAGSDAHTLRRVGTTWTEAPGRDRDEFLSSVRSGLGRPGGREGGALAASADAYGVIRGYMASLAGLERSDHSGWRRAACLGFAVGSLPFQFLPFAIASKGKLHKRRKVRALESWMSAGLGWAGSGTSVGAVEAHR